MRRPSPRRAPLPALATLLAAACGAGGVKAPPVRVTACGAVPAGDPVTLAAAYADPAHPPARLDGALLVAIGRDVAAQYRDAIAVTVDLFPDSAAVRCRARGDTTAAPGALASYTFDRRTGDERHSLATVTFVDPPAAAAPAAR